jgi:hypothetical protein
MARNMSHAFASERWTTIPFQCHSKTLFDLLVDILFSMTRCLAVADKLISSPAKERGILKSELCTLVQGSLSQIKLWPQGISWPNSSDDAVQTSSNISDSTLETAPPSFQNIAYHDLPTASLSAFYDTANMVIISLLFLVSQSEGTNKGRISIHAQSIISACEFINTNNCPDPMRGALMMLLPLKMVNLWSPSPLQRNQAAEIIMSLNGNEQFNNATRGAFFEDVATYIRYHHSTAPSSNFASD